MLAFGQTSPFVADAKRLKLVDEDLQALETLLLERPDRGAVVAGAGGVRKVRFAPPSWNVGKSGASRVVYAYFAKVGQVYLLLAYGKDEQANLTPDEKAACREWVRRIEESMG
jgi:hypothetical protein